VLRGALRLVPPREARARSWLADRALQASAVVPLRGLAAVVRAANATLRLERIEAHDGKLPSALVGIPIGDDDAGSDRRAVIGLAPSAARSLVDATLGRIGGSAPDRLSSGEQGVLLYIADRIGGDWLAAGGAGFVVRGVFQDRRQVEGYLGQGPRWQVCGRLSTDRLDAPVWIWCGERLPPPGPGPALRLTEAALEWPVSWQVVAGAAKLPLAQLEGLAPGDVVVLDWGGHPAAPASGGRLRLWSGDSSHPGRWLDHRHLELLSLDERRQEMTGKRPEMIETRLDDPAVQGAAGLDVVLRAEVGRVTTTVEQALALVPGRVIGLDREVGTTVSLMIGEQKVASGELVESGGRLAVEITEVP